MKREKDFSDIFDDDFEVTYEDGWEEDQDNYDDDRSRRQDYDLSLIHIFRTVSARSASDRTA